MAKQVKRPVRVRLPNMEWRKLNTPRDPLLEERQRTHGSFTDNATMSQGLKTTMQGSDKYFFLAPVHKESLEMIALKISRILSGQAGVADHWNDIAGYAKLGAEICDD